MARASAGNPEARAQAAGTGRGTALHPTPSRGSGKRRNHPRAPGESSTRWSRGVCLRLKGSRIAPLQRAPGGRCRRRSWGGRGRRSDGGRGPTGCSSQGSIGSGLQLGCGVGSDMRGPRGPAHRSRAGSGSVPDPPLSRRASAPDPTGPDAGGYGRGLLRTRGAHRGSGASSGRPGGSERLALPAVLRSGARGQAGDGGLPVREEEVTPVPSEGGEARIAEARGSSRSVRSRGRPSSSGRPWISRRGRGPGGVGVRASAISSGTLGGGPGRAGGTGARAGAGIGRTLGRSGSQGGRATGPWARFPKGVEGCEGPRMRPLSVPFPER